MDLRSLFAVVVVVVASSLVACKHNSKPGEGEVDATIAGDACTDLPCFIVDCGSKGLPSTSISGTVFAPNGTLPLYGVNVYVPASDPGPLPAGVQCDQCANGLLGGSLAATVTDEAGHFQLDGVPATSDVPIVVQVGKWRRQLKLPTIAACQDTPLLAAQTTLPRTKSEGDLPQIAITTGNADALECLVRKLGVADSEFTTDAGGGAIHLYEGNGANKFAPGFAGGTGAFSSATPFWDSPARLSAYDIVLLSCEGDQFTNTKPQSSLQAVHDYAGIGGRVFMSHWHNVWIGGDRASTAGYGLPDWKSIGNFNFAAPQDQEDTIASIDEAIPKGMSFASWLVNVGASTTRGQVPISGARYTLPSADQTKSDRRVYLEPALSNNHVSVQDLQFTTPNDVAEGQRCGKVVFSDMHVSSGSRSRATVPFPNDCNTGDLTPQEKALAFIFFDISSCVGVLQ